jgi:flagella basal body P-ring formation protein FlgA
MRRLLILAAAALSLSGGLASPALAGQPVTLKADTVDADGVVTFADLFDGAGASGRVTIANRAGATLLLDAVAVQAAARRAGLDWANSEGLRSILVRSAPSQASAAASPAVAARGNVEVLTYARSLAAGDIVQPTDLVWTKAAAAPNDAPADADAVIGMAARRPLRAGAFVAARDVGAAMVVRPGDTVTVAFEADGISLALEGKAMTAAGVGETVSVQNSTSKKIIQAVVTGPGQAVVGPAADQMKATRSTRYAAR